MGRAQGVTGGQEVSVGVVGCVVDGAELGAPGGYFGGDGLGILG